MTKNAALHWATEGIRVNSVHPGFIATPILEQTKGTDYWNTMVELTPMGHLGQPEDIAAAVAYLASDDAKFVTGLELYVDGVVRRTGPVAVGARGMETPIGLFFVQSRFVPSKYPILGAFAFETSGYSKLSDWPGGGVVGVHGTNAPWLIGQAVSHGCVRLRNSDVLALRKLVRVGTPVKIVAA